MKNSISHARGLWRWIVSSSAIALLLMTMGPVDAVSQRNSTVCDSLWVVAKASQEDRCCFTFVLENGLSGDPSINKVTMSVASNAYTVTSASGPNVSRQNNIVSWSWRTTVPERTDDLSACFGSNLGGPIDRPFHVVFNWYSGDRVVCSDTLELDCSPKEECLSVIEQEIECLDRTGSAGQVYGWHFNIKNLSDFYGRNWTLTPVTQGISITPSSGSAQTPVAPNGVFPRGHVTITGGQPGQIVVFEVEMCGSSGPNTRDIRCCTTRVAVKLPECEAESDCLTILQSSVECERTPNGASRYIWCFSFKNNANFPINTIQVGNSTVNVGPVAPGGTGRACVPVYGQPGVHNIGLLACYESRDSVVGGGGRNDTVHTERRCCDMRVELRLPECDSEGCFELVEQEVFCDSSGEGYVWCFQVRNNAQWPMGHFNLNAIQNTPNGQVSISPQTIQFDRPIPPGGVSGRVCVRIHGARPGVLNVVGWNCASLIQVCCSDTIRIELPECEKPHRECCDNFDINLTQTRPVAAPNGYTGLIGLISAGPAPIKKASATIVYSTVNGQPASGFAVNGLILNPLGIGQVVPPGFGEEIIWTSNTGVNMNTPTFALNWLKFPPMAPNARQDTLRFCIRWRFTDTECRTCDTLVCYTVVRRNFFSIDNALGTLDEKGHQTQGGGGRITGELTGDNSGSLSITFPQLPEAEYGTVTFNSLTIQANGATISNATVTSGNTQLDANQGLVQGDINATAGETMSIDLEYADLNGASSLPHMLIFGFESSKQPGVSLDLPATITLRQKDAAGGDEVNAIRAEVEGKLVKTYAIHIMNANKSGEPLSGVRLRASDDMEILAVGPTSSSTEALLRFGANGDDGHDYVSEASEGTVLLPAGAERKPIYLTIAYDGELSPTVEYTTLNQHDDPVSTGVVDLEQISGIEHDGGSVVAGSAYLGDVRPNPTTESASLTIQLPHGETNVSLVITDANGREVKRLFDGNQLEAGTHVISFDVSELASGTYFYRLDTPTTSATRKMVVQK